MSNWLRFILTVVVGAHGLGHVLFLIPLLGVADWGQPTRSWLLGDGWLARGLGSLFWLVAIVGFTAVAYGPFNVVVGGSDRGSGRFQPGPDSLLGQSGKLAHSFRPGF